MNKNNSKKQFSHNQIFSREIDFSDKKSVMKKNSMKNIELYDTYDTNKQKFSVLSNDNKYGFSSLIKKEMKNNIIEEMFENDDIDLKIISNEKIIKFSEKPTIPIMEMEMENENIIIEEKGLENPKEKLFNSNESLIRRLSSSNYLTSINKSNSISREFSPKEINKLFQSHKSFSSKIIKTLRSFDNINDENIHISSKFKKNDKEEKNLYQYDNHYKDSAEIKQENLKILENSIFNSSDCSSDPESKDSELNY